MPISQAQAVIDALRPLEIGDEVDIIAVDYCFCGMAGTVVGFSDYTGSIQIRTPKDGPLWFQRSELRLV